MPLPRPASPKALIADLRAFLADRRPHQLLAAFLAIAMPIIIVIGFIVDARTNTAPPPQLIYVESWSAARSDAEIVADQKRRQAEREALEAERRRQYQELEKKFGIE
jgi:hypothetical protein